MIILTIPPPSPAVLFTRTSQRHPDEHHDTKPVVTHNTYNPFHTQVAVRVNWFPLAVYISLFCPRCRLNHKQGTNVGGISMNNSFFNDYARFSLSIRALFFFFFLQSTAFLKQSTIFSSIKQSWTISYLNVCGVKITFIKTIHNAFFHWTIMNNFLFKRFVE